MWYIPPPSPTPTTPPAPTPATWTNPPDWEPYPGDHVKIHIKGDGWLYSKYDIFDGDLGTLSHERLDGWIVLFDKPRGRYEGLFFRLDQLEWVK